MGEDQSSAFQDPCLAQLCGLAESMILAADTHAKSIGVTLTDSTVRSAVNKARALTAGKSPKSPEGRPCDAIVWRLAEALHGMRDELASEPSDSDAENEPETEEAEPVSASDWCALLVESSSPLRSARVPCQEAGTTWSIWRCS